MSLINRAPKTREEWLRRHRRGQTDVVVTDEPEQERVYREHQVGCFPTFAIHTWGENLGPALCLYLHDLSELSSLFVLVRIPIQLRCLVQGANRQYMRDMILGANDGLVSMFLLVLGLAGGGLNTKALLLAGTVTRLCL